MNTLNNKVILITGGTGSFGQVFAKNVLKNFPKIRKLIIFSRDELKQHDMSLKFNNEKMRYFLGDVRDKERLVRAFAGVDIVVHAAALKQVPAAEYNPMEFIKTNIIGATNVIDASLDCNVSKTIALSTDKASGPINLYGATKLCSDKLFTSAGRYSGSKKIIFSVVRYGNVWGSRGSVVPLFSKISKDRKIEVPITHPEMTRFNINLQESIDLVLWAIKNSSGGEIFIPKIPSYNIMDLAKAICPNNKIKIVGIRPGEKIHEELISESESLNTVDLGKYYAILLPQSFKKNKKLKRKLLLKNDSYNSRDNNHFLNVEDLQYLAKINQEND
jgi:UDP-N-acetylglucosamine 4,6-dehydratase